MRLIVCVFTAINGKAECRTPTTTMKVKGKARELKGEKNIAAVQFEFNDGGLRRESVMAVSMLFPIVFMSLCYLTNNFKLEEVEI